MESLFDVLEDWGCSAGAGLEHFFGDADLYHSNLQNFVNNESFEQIYISLVVGDFKSMFHYAFSLREAADKLGLSPIVRTAEDIMQELNDGNYEDLSVSYELLKQQHDYYCDLMGKTMTVRKCIMPM